VVAVSFKRVKPFIILGAVIMTVGVYLLTTLDVDSTQATVAVYLAITGLGLGQIMPTATLAVQSTVSREIIGVATSATQFIRSLGSTVGTAVIGSIVTKGYAENLAANAPAQAPDRLVSALNNPQALVSDEARAALSRAVSAFPGGEQLLNQVIDTAREALSGSIHDGFVFTLVGMIAAIGAALLMKNIRLEEQGAAPAPAPVSRDRQEDLLTGVTLAYLSRRVESANGDSPNLIRAVSELVSPNGDASERDRALQANDEVLKPLSQQILMDYLREKNGEVVTQRGAES